MTAVVDDRDDEFDLDFFGEDEEETAEGKGGQRFGRSRSTAEGRPPGVVTRRRLVAVGVAAAIVLLIVVAVVTSGGSGGPASANYVAKLTPIAASSQRTGQSLGRLMNGLGTGSTKRDQALATLGVLVARAQSDVAGARRIKPPKQLSAVQAQVVSALDFRVSGLQRLRQSLSRAFAAKNAASFAPSVSRAIDRLVTSDVLWRDLVVTPLSAVLVHDRATGSAPQSQVVTNPNELSSTSIDAVLRPTTAGGSQVIRFGDHGPAVLAWQKLLNRWLHLTAPTQARLVTDGSFGQGTLTTTEALQRAQGITPDGVVGPATRRALQQALAGRTSSSATG